jgi:putative Ca2+/H+ antiporter (TMEM165/GDT1 family)
MRSAWASGLHLRSRVDEERGAGYGVNTFKQSALIQRRIRTHVSCYSRPFRDANQGVCLEAFLVSTGVVALAEIGDKTQLLALVLAARFRAPLPVIGGILTATLANHFAAGAVGTLLAAYLDPQLMRWLLAASFLATALWMLIPDRDAGLAERPAHFGAYGTTVISFFLMEIGDKTQIATVALAARYHALLAVVAGTTLGMMLADVPVVLLGRAAAQRLPMQWVHRVAAGVFVVLAVLVLTGVSG